MSVNHFDSFWYCGDCYTKLYMAAFATLGLGRDLLNGLGMIRLWAQTHYQTISTSEGCVKYLMLVKIHNNQVLASKIPKPGSRPFYKLLTLNKMMVFGFFFKH